MTGNAVRTMAATFVTDTTNPPAPRHRLLLLRGRWDLVEIADAITAFICWLTANAWLSTHNGGRGNAMLLLAAFVTCAPLVLRTRYPVTAWVVTALAIIGTKEALPLDAIAGGVAVAPASLVVYGLCLYAVTVRCKPRIVVAAAIATWFGSLLIHPGAAVATFFLSAIPLLLGAIVRMRRSSERQLAEQERRHSGERALLEERQRIARELHDVVAHHMSVIAIQAEAAPYKTADPPEELVRSFGEIRSSALTGLTEMRRLLGVLRTGEQTTTPQPGLEGLDALLDSARGGGVSVTASITGRPVPLPEGVDLSAYRILQEALSNAMRHAPGSRVHVRLAYSDDSLEIEVRNEAAPPGRTPAVGAVTHAAVVRGGHGIIGMRERAAMLGGSLFAAPMGDGGFRVTAALPVSQDLDEATP